MPPVGPSAPSRRRRLRPEADSVVVVVAGAAYILLALNASLWWRLAGFLGYGVVPLLTFGLAAFAANLLLIALFDFRPTLKPALAALALIGAVASYYVDVFGIVIDHDMIRNVAQTDASEAGRLVTAKFVMHVLLFGVLPGLALLFVRVRRRPLGRRLASVGLIALVAVLAAAGSVAANFRTYASVWRSHHVDLVGRLNPLNAVLGTIDLAVRLNGERAVAVAPLGSDARVAPGRPKRLLVLVIGETARAQNFGLDGYARDTTPELKARNVLNFAHVSSCGTATAVSLPCMFSHFGRAGYSGARAASSENLMDVLRRAGLQLAWLDNNSGSKGVADRVPYDFVSKAADPRFCRDGECDDGILLDLLAKRLADVSQDAVIVLHAVGSHGPAYYSRYPQARATFTPDCRTPQLSDCPVDQIVNAYDNTILYTDHILAGIVDQLTARGGDAAMLYVSDHGESLGEMGLYLHGMPYMIAPETQTHVPMVAWFSDSLAATSGLDIACVRAGADRPLSHDNLFDTALGLMSVETAIYDRSLDIFAPCRTAAPQRSAGEVTAAARPRT